MMTWSDWNRHSFTFPGEPELLAVHRNGTMLTNLEAKFLAYLATKAPLAGEIVEIGSRSGKSTAYLARVARNLGRAPIYAIDLWDEAGTNWNRSGTYERFTAMLAGLDLHEMVRPLRGDSRQIGAAWQSPIALLFIDGDHSYEGARADYELFSPHVVPGGILAFHDSHHQRYPDVRRVIQEIVIPSGLWSEPYELENRAGIWCARRRSD